MIEAQRNAVDEASMEDRCDNWGQAMRWRRYRTLRTPSLEGHYRPPRGVEVDWATRAPQKRAGIDLYDAQVVEEGVCTLPRYSHALLRLWHIEKIDPRFCLRIAARLSDEPQGQPRGFGSAIRMAYALLAAALLLPSEIRKARARARVVVIPLDALTD